jgi:hypothetical protein
MSFQGAFNGWKISFVREGRTAGSWFNPGTTTGNCFAYGRRERKPARKSEKVYSLSNGEEGPPPLFSIYGVVPLSS